MPLLRNGELAGVALRVFHANTEALRSRQFLHSERGHFFSALVPLFTRACRSYVCFIQLAPTNLCGIMRSYEQFMHPAVSQDCLWHRAAVVSTIYSCLFPSLTSVSGRMYTLHLPLCPPRPPARWSSMVRLAFSCFLALRYYWYAPKTIQFLAMLKVPGFASKSAVSRIGSEGILKYLNHLLAIGILSWFCAPQS